MYKQSLFFIFMLLVAPLALADSDIARKTDVVVLYNGDKVTGEIKSLYAGLLEVSTSSMGTVNIEWQDIAKMTSRHNYEFRLAEGKRYYGTIGKADRPGEVRVLDVYGEHSMSAMEIVEMRPVATSLADQIEIYLSLGYSYTKASSVGQSSINTIITYDTEQTSNTLNGRITVTDADGPVTRSSRLDLTRNIWTDKAGTYRAITGAYESNDELALDYRYSVGGGIGRYFTDTQHSSWTGLLGAQVLTEKSTDGDTQESVEGILNTRFSLWKYDTPELNIIYNLSIYPSLSEWGRYRGDTDLKLRWEIVEDLFWDITAFGTYDNEAAEDSQFDYGITTGVGWEY